MDRTNSLGRESSIGVERLKKFGDKIPFIVSFSSVMRFMKTCMIYYPLKSVCLMECLFSLWPFQVFSCIPRVDCDGL